MEPMKKPEWFELAESDGPKPRPLLKSGFRTLALSIPLLAISVGVVAAQTSNESPAIAETQSVAIASAAPSITSNVAQAKLPLAHHRFHLLVEMMMMSLKMKMTTITKKTTTTN